MKRVLLKLSGEALAGEKKTGFDEATVIEVAKQIREISKEGLEIGIVMTVCRWRLLQEGGTSGEDVPVRQSTEIRQTRSECLLQ